MSGTERMASIGSTKGDLPVCPKDGEPVIFTFEFPGAEYVCVVCGSTYGIFSIDRALAADGLVARYEELSEQYEAERVARGGAPRPPQPDGSSPVCAGCGAVAPTAAKPPHWFSRERDGETQCACSRDCITEGAVLPW